MTPEALARVLCDAYAPIAGADGWDGIEAFPVDKAAWIAVATTALAALMPAPTTEWDKGHVYGPGVSVPPLPPDTPPPPEPEVREALDLYWKVVGAQPVEGTKILEAALARARGK